ncbi:hypothetical protein FSP39_013788 [Pinctada imbricata]|uniref:Transposase Helix-turn-helix domain-containing protein n=1 Tax=Pinctada imbricata TaxID=66713 RepID=A0AA88YX00_PINIB|nr:hypothetical protein FSP39_013788 [Pinctada imbricata]
MPTAPYRQLKRLKRDAVPTKFDWTINKEPRRKLFRAKPMSLPTKVQLSDSVDSPKVHESYASLPFVNTVENRDETEVNEDHNEPTDELNTSSSSDDSLTNMEEAASPDKSQIQQTNIQLLHLRNREKFTILRFSNSDSDIRYYTGFSTYSALTCFYSFLLPAANFLYYVGTENTSSGTPYALLNKRGPSRTLSPMEELFITLVRLRKGLSEKLIGDLYNLSEGTISRILNTWIIFLSERLKSFPIWPSKDHVKESMPTFFKDSYPTTRAIIDCTEMFIEQPSAADCQRV